MIFILLAALGVPLLIIFLPVLILLAIIICFYILWKILKCPMMRIFRYLFTIFGIILIPLVAATAFFIANYISGVISDILMPSPKETDNTTTTTTTK